MKMKICIVCTILMLTFSACSTGGDGDTSPSASPSAENPEVYVSDDSEGTKYDNYTLEEALDEYPDEENMELGIIIMDSFLADPTAFVQVFAASGTDELVYLLISTTVEENLQYGDSAYLDAVNSVDTDALTDSEKEVYQYILNNIEAGSV